MKMQIRVLGAAALLLCGSPLLAAGEGRQIFENQCVSCHAVNAPARSADHLERIWQRKGPDLYHAGDKFREAWLAAWLQAPTPIRPGGVMYSRHLTAGEEGDQIDIAAVEQHPTLDAAAAASVAEHLTSLHAPEGYLEDIEIGTPSRMDAKMGRLFFKKLRGCAACHQDGAGEGGRSGPQLYTAGKRLTPEYVYSYMKNPQKFDPGVWMPDLGLNETDLKRLTAYVLSLSEEE